MLSPMFDETLLSRVEDAGLNASAPPQQRWVDGWLVRFSPGKAKRARCVNAVAAGRLPLADRLDACAQVLALAGLPLIVRITPFTQPAGLDALLERKGLRRFDDTRVMVLESLPEAVAPPAPKVTVQTLGLEAFAQRVGSLRGSPLAQRQAHAQRLASSPVPFFAFELRVDGEPLACGQFAAEGDLVGLYDVYTANAARGQGLAATLCRHMLVQARAHGARHAYLQVEADNLAARSVYRRLGFADGYAYHYRTLDPAAA
ncbi:MAG: GNAT family N-acetyltransferase [Burkholderiales bacterium]|nr:GNAT family N-acetyltransferase [Burkholderiales bacterium]